MTAYHLKGQAALTCALYRTVCMYPRDLDGSPVREAVVLFLLAVKLTESER